MVCVILIPNHSLLSTLVGRIEKSERRKMFYLLSLLIAIILAFVLGDYLYKQGIMGDNPKFIEEWMKGGKKCSKR